MGKKNVGERAILKEERQFGVCYDDRKKMTEFDFVR